MLPGDSALLRKARGAYYTPTPVARFIAEWAVRGSLDDVLEPSCGEAVFLQAAARIRGPHTGRLVGVELHADSALESQRVLHERGVSAAIHAGDFFQHNEFGAYDAVIGNPPYVRYQDFTGESRARAREAALRGGVALSNLASSWAAFTVHAAHHLKRGGRLGLVLPAELLTVNYAAGVRKFLVDHFASVGLVLFKERVFPDVQEEVVVLLADGFDAEGSCGTGEMTLWQLPDARHLDGLTTSRRWSPPANGSRWSAGLMSPAGSTAFERATASDGFCVLERWGDTTLGIVTGNNRFFAVSPAKADELGLAPTDTVTLSPPGSRHLRALTFTRDNLAALGAGGAATLLFRPAGEPSPGAWRYIESGEDLDVHRAYKCRIRRPWWRVPYVEPADLLLTYMNADTPRLATNRARAHHLNSVHGVYLKADVRALGTSLLPLASLNSITLLGAETVGRAYGGGMLKIEPREADGLPVPSPELLARCASELTELRRPVTRLLRGGELLAAVELVDAVLLTDALGLPPRHLRAVRHDRAELAARRLARGRSTGGR